MKHRVPLGFICGYPVDTGGELYGGSMYIASAANNTLQGCAIHSINERWGEGPWAGRETIGIPVCKKKYIPFDFQTKKTEDGLTKISVTRMFGCAYHSQLRKQLIEKNGERNGWEPYGQWSLSKAKSHAKKKTERLSSSSDENASYKYDFRELIWKMKGKYDDVFSEIHNTK